MRNDKSDYYDASVFAVKIMPRKYHVSDELSQANTVFHFRRRFSKFLHLHNGLRAISPFLRYSLSFTQILIMLDNATLECKGFYALIAERP